MRPSNDPFSNIWFPFSYSQDLLDTPPLVIERGEGVYLYDAAGRAYLDAIGSWWVNILGHGNPEIAGAIREQTRKLEHVLMAGFVAAPTVEAVNLLASMLPPGLGRIFLSDNGSTAVEVALKIALQYWALRGEQRTEFVALGGGYHGDTLGAMSVGMLPQYHELFHRRYKSFHYTLSPYCYRCPMGANPVSCGAECMDSLDSILRERGRSIAACVFEPIVQAAGGMRIYPAKVLTRVIRQCKEFGVLTIDDEVAMGFGRTGKLFACEYTGETPDIMCLAKGLTGGFLPLAATAVRDHIYQEFRGAFPSDRILYHGHSFTGNALASAAAAATLRIVLREDIPRSLAGTIRHFAAGMRLFDEFDIVGDIRTVGMIGAIELVKDRSTRERLDPQQRTAFRIARRALELGLLIRPLGDVLYFMPAYVITEEQIDTMLSLARKAISWVVNERHAAA